MTWDNIPGSIDIRITITMSLRAKVAISGLLIILSYFNSSAQDVVISGGIFRPSETKNESPFRVHPGSGYTVHIQNIYGYDWNVITGIKYIMNRFDLEGSITDSMGMSSVVSDNLTMQTINVPIYLSRTLGSDDIGVRPYAGFDISFILGMNENSFDLIKDDFDKIQLWLTGGIALDLSRVVISGEYSYGLGRYFKAEENNLRFGYVSATIGFRL